MNANTKAQDVQATEVANGALAGKTGLRPCKLGLGLRRLRLSTSFVCVPPLLRQLTPKIRLLGLRSHQPL